MDTTRIDDNTIVVQTTYVDKVFINLEDLKTERETKKIQIQDLTLEVELLDNKIKEYEALPVEGAEVADKKEEAALAAIASATDTVILKA